MRDQRGRPHLEAVRPDQAGRHALHLPGRERLKLKAALPQKIRLVAKIRKNDKKWLFFGPPSFSKILSDKKNSTEQ